jgi:1-acyl-sn-glycerol-3-phosphate acyltransferase
MKNSKPAYKNSYFLSIRRGISRFVFRGIFRILFNIELTGFENVPKSGAYVIAYNHVSVFEPPFILSFWPSPPEAVTGADVLDRPFQGPIVKLYKAIPVDRGNYDRNAINTMVNILSSELPLAISPEGGRSREIGMRKAWPGIIYLLEKTGVPIVPVAVTGTTDSAFRQIIDGNRPTFKMEIGTPFYLPEFEDTKLPRKIKRQKKADYVMLEIGKMLPEPYHGVYSGQILPSEK